MIDFRRISEFPGYLVTSDGKVWSSADRRHRDGKWQIVNRKTWRHVQ